MSTAQEELIVRQGIKTLLDKGEIQRSHHEPGEFTSTNFLRPKSEEFYRMILTLTLTTLRSHFNDKCKWALNTGVFQEITVEYPEFNKDLFATRANQKLIPTVPGNQTLDAHL